MSSKWWLHRGATQIQWQRNEEPLELLTIFTEADKYTDDAWLQAIDRLEGYGRYSPEDEEQQRLDEILVEESNGKDVLGYRARVSRIRARLALMGFTANACRHELSLAIDEMLADDEPGDTLEVADKDGEAVETIPRSEILDRGLAAWENEKPYRSLGPVDRKCATYIDILMDSGFDRRTILALQLESAPADVEVCLDLHDLYSAGYFNSVENITQLAADELAVSVSSGGPIVVVTEGVTDARFLQRALELVVPHVSHMFRFFDKDAGAEMGAAQVVRTLRSFAAAGVTNRVVGVLDNDAAGLVAAKNLDAKVRPANNRYFLLPDVPYGANYPTYGPNGDSDLNVNGRAVSIEFQFGLEQLRLASGDPARVEWSGREASIGVYQGSLPKKDKDAVQKKIRDFLANASPDHDPEAEPWPAVHALVNRLLEAATPESFPGQSFTKDDLNSSKSNSRP
ncbi:hypothetical protein CVV68_01135 [Arthrobacter livingstonensis]|uniref:Uncharacterized protein n=1 Tax=Arthrobacter livingstonensis TaxID=670078 RepID=A0A2V5LHS7_9MICC|nr:HEPN/Toprim-associated domain-containing protein [Arthrobacter livingstonensis]PYI69743.1 hypothetical protein CVV68_01135 [Arthrobacter livingstonensis]